MRFCGILATIAAALLIARTSAAADHCGQAAAGCPTCCAHCGCRASCQQKACQVVCGTKKETRTRWVVKCEDFCAPLPSLACHCRGECGGTCESCRGASGCASCAQGGGERCASCKEKPLVPPKCCKVRTKKILVKEEYQVEVPTYKCVVVYLCDRCCNGNAAGQSEGCGKEASPLPPAKPVAPKPPAPPSRGTY